MEWVGRLVDLKALYWKRRYVRVKIVDLDLADPDGRAWFYGKYA